MQSSKYNRYDCSCIDLRLLNRERGSRQPWLLMAIQYLKKAYKDFRRTNPALSSSSSQDHLADRFIWAAGLIVFVIAMLK